VILHYRTALEVAVAGRWRPSDLQDLRGERRARIRADEVLAYSPRVAAGTTATPVPIGLDVPDEALPGFERPVAACLADWRWPPNRQGLDVLLQAWPAVRTQVPDAELRLAGSGQVDTGGLPGVVFLGWVEHSEDVLAESALVAFPYPPSSGPKMKVLEAMAHGRPVVTTEWGMEGLNVPAGQGAVLAAFEPRSFASAVAELLASPDQGHVLGMSGRAAVVEGHAPEPVAAAQVRALLRRWPELGEGRQACAQREA
jgi:glycosyltransferase involved in cell wall biosynthesis